MNAIKQYKELVVINLKDGRKVITELSLKKVAELLNTNDFIVIGNVGFGKYEVRTFDRYEPTDIDNFVFSQPKDIQITLNEIINERKEKGFKINSTEHLWSIYQKRFINLK